MVTCDYFHWLFSLVALKSARKWKNIFPRSVEKLSERWQIWCLSSKMIVSISFRLCSLYSPQNCNQTFPVVKYFENLFHDEKMNYIDDAMAFVYSSIDYLCPLLNFFGRLSIQIQVHFQIEFVLLWIISYDTSLTFRFWFDHWACQISIESLLKRNRSWIAKSKSRSFQYYQRCIIRMMLKKISPLFALHW